MDYLSKNLFKLYFKLPFQLVGRKLRVITGALPSQILGRRASVVHTRDPGVAWSQPGSLLVAFLTRHHVQYTGNHWPVWKPACQGGAFYNLSSEVLLPPPWCSATEWGVSHCHSWDPIPSLDLLPFGVLSLLFLL